MGAAVKSMGQSVENVSDKEGKYLTFSLANEDYGIGILKIKEIIGMMPITKVPRCPEFVKGVINLRGKVIPVLDLRMRFGVDAAEYTERTCIVVVEVDSGRSSISSPMTSKKPHPSVQRWRRITSWAWRRYRAG
jgi:purine-binding chemotaxis protein CheW